MTAHEPAWITRLERAPSDPAPKVDTALLIDYPVELGLRREERRHDLLREFQLITYGVHDHHEQVTVPRRLLALADEMTQRFGIMIEQHTLELEKAMAQGDDQVVLRYPLSDEARNLEIEFAKAMEDSDAYCRDEALMTVAPAPEIYALRRWIAEEVVHQYDGHQPRAWGDFLAELATEMDSTPDGDGSTPHP